MDFYEKYYSQLIGFVVTGVVFETDEYEGTVFPALVLKHPDGTEVRAVVSSDVEGNSAGFLFLEEVQ